MLDKIKALLSGARAHEASHAAGKAHVSQRTKERLAALVKSVLPANFKDAKWRRMTWPGCPACQHCPMPCYCADPRFWLQVVPKTLWKFTPNRLRCIGEMYLNVETGLVVCSECGSRQGLADSEFVCDAGCGAMFRGGEVWEGMKVDLANARQWTWMRSMKARVQQEIFDCGWSGMTRLQKSGGARRCGCSAHVYRLDQGTDICGNCLQRWPV